MHTSTGVALGLMGAFCWGSADFAARFSSRRIGAYRALFFMQFFGLVLLSAWLKFTGGFSRGVAPGWQPWAMAAFAGLLNVAGSLALYHAFEVGTLSIVGPVSSCYPALTVVLSLLSGEHIHQRRGVGLAVTLLGVLLASTSVSSLQKNGAGDGVELPAARWSKGVGSAIGAALCFGIMFWFLGFLVLPAVGAPISVWVIRLTSIVSLGLVAAPAGQSLALPRGMVWWALFAAGILDTSAFLANNAGMQLGPVSVVSVLASLYGAFTVLLAWIFLRERLEISQWFGIALIFAGIVLVSA
ncbi:MAG TPA: DMT family transporter [Candidatus Acidoferrales bacterium]